MENWSHNECSGFAELQEARLMASLIRSSTGAEDV